jgi:hypothetical protein
MSETVPQIKMMNKKVTVTVAKKGVQKRKEMTQGSAAGNV